MQDPKRYLNERETLYEPIEHIAHDPDDPIPQETPADKWWGLMNRYGELMIRYARFLGFL